MHLYHGSQRDGQDDPHARYYGPAPRKTWKRALCRAGYCRLTPIGQGEARDRLRAPGKSDISLIDGKRKPPDGAYGTLGRRSRNTYRYIPVIARP